jgi:hypothetical protein
MEISLEELRKFVTDHQSDFSEVMRHLSQIEPLQDGISVGYFPRAVRQNVRSTARITLYRDGLTAYDAQADTYMDRDNELNPYWMSYEILRQLQLSKALLEPHGAEALTTTIELNHIEAFEMIYSAPGYGPSARWSSPYGGRHEAIVRNIPLDEIPAYNGPSRNSAPPILEGIMDEVSRIFGLSRTPPGVWDTQRKLAYVSGLETQR